jgi:hypothetical protein
MTVLAISGCCHTARAVICERLFSTLFSAQRQLETKKKEKRDYLLLFLYAYAPTAISNTISIIITATNA